MSTKSTIRFRQKNGELPGWQLYTELFEKEDVVYLELEGVQADLTMIGGLWGAVSGTVLLRLPMTTARQLGLVSEAKCMPLVDNSEQDLGETNTAPEELTMATCHWNYRIIEFRKGEETWREVREVHYENGHPFAYSEVGASLRWQGDESPDLQLARMREALSRPVLRPEDFHPAGEG